MLDVGAGNQNRRDEFPGSEYITTDIDDTTGPDLVHDITQPLPEELQGTFDLVIASHVLEHIPQHLVVNTLRNLRDALKDGGELQIYVPSMDWVAEELYFRPRVMGRLPSPVVWSATYGMGIDPETGQENVFQMHKSGFTIMDLRHLFKVLGIVERHFGQGHFTIVTGLGEEHVARQIIAIGVRNLEYERQYDQTDAARALHFD